MRNPPGWMSGRVFAQISKAEIHFMIWLNVLLDSDVTLCYTLINDKVKC